MADMPAEIASSAAQSSIQAREVANARNANRAANANAANRQIQAVEQAGSTVETEDADTQVHADAEGTGSQGRPFEDTGESAQENTDEQVDKGITRDKDGRIHLDLEA